ncbi:CHAT domain-containing protein [Streptomyces sp. NBS 14/10]|uniref:CHAT domain-containing protein n=1 Tax=Streptomyces sp. NBS 14/10 TaxID=1945643 RepID=UPI000B7DE1B9|nr:CHAT domain-containing protein [Streptomyces sp. NBS 14/10]KAK1185582.1 CHAT domain-containing protein [Streptomyces sp. NBS 14/10]
MGDEGESGGVQALRAWAGEAIGRAKALLPTPGTVAKPSRAHDDAVTELDALTRLLDHDPELRSSVTLWLGGALTLRHGVGGGTPEDRERAHGLLRNVRDPATSIGAATSTEDRRWAALFLLTHAMPLQEMLGGLSPEPDATAMFDMIMREGPNGIAAFAAELQELVTEAAELPLPPETLGQLRQVRDLYASPSAGGIADLFTSLMPDDGFPGNAHLRQKMTDLLTTMTGGAGPTSGTGTAPGTGSDNTGDTRATRDPSHKADAPAPSAEAPAGASAMPRTPDDIRRLIAAWQAVNTTSVDFVNHVGGGDPAALNQQLGRLRDALDGLPDGMADKDALGGLMALLLNVSDGAGGTLQDQALGLAHIQTVTDYLRRKSETSIPMADGLAIMADVMGLITDVRTAAQAEDVKGLRDLLPKAEALADTVPEDHDIRFIVLIARAMARLMLGRHTMDRDLLLRGLADFEEGRTAARNSSLPIGYEELEALVPDLATLRSYLTDDTTTVIPDRDVPPPDAPADQLHTAANRLGMRYGLTKDPADLEATITTLERLREHVRQGRAPRVAAESLWSLAESYRARWHREQNASDADAATDAANEALTALAADVLLQHGAEHRLTTARNGASLGVRAALWAAAHGRVADAVAALELGRALVLQSAATSRAVPDLLDERGHPELAAAWRGSGAADSTELPAELPSTLRRQALEALGYRERGGLLDTPTPRELADGVGAAGADALIYLVPGSEGDGEAPGMLLAIGPEIGIGVGALPMLSEAGSAPLERYLDAAAARSMKHSAETERAWEVALSELCDWAYEVFVHVLAGLEEHLPDDATDAADRRTPRVVLVPCGRLGIVPWHAARFPADAPYDHLCQALVISYAASGSQFLRTVKRAPRDPIAAPAMVADPSITLTYAEQEVLELRNAFYPGARLYGDFGTLPPDSVPTGTPDQLLALLAQDHSMVHLATHGLAGVRPTESALHLAPTDPGEEVGRLTVTRLLDRPQPAEQAAPDGPLIVLSACQTDLSTRDHDEALTLTTAFVSGGARDVVGSRWTAQDSATILLMAVFHHGLRAGLSPVDALRAAQLWMLDPERKDPGCLSDTLRHDIRRPDLQRPALWAAFIHQGHPGQGKETV